MSVTETSSGSSELSLHLTKAQELIDSAKQRRALDELWEAEAIARGNTDAIRKMSEFTAGFQEHVESRQKARLAELTAALEEDATAATRPRPMLVAEQSQPRPPASSSEEVPVPGTAKTAFWVTVAIVALTLFSFGVIGGLGDTSASWSIAYFIIFLIPLGSLFVAVTGIVGFVRSRRVGSQKGMFMSATPLMVVLILILVRIAVSL